MASITKRGNSYRIKVSCGYDIYGKQIVHTMTWKPDKDMTQKQAEKEVEKQAIYFEDKCLKGLYSAKTLKFIDFSEQWLKEYAQKQLKAKTNARYTEMLKRINAEIGHIRLDKLQPINIIQFYNKLSEEGERADIKYKSNIDLLPLILSKSETKTSFANTCNISIRTLNNALKGYNVSHITAQQISNTLNIPLQELFSQTGKTTLAPKTIQYYHRLLSSMLQTAVQWQLIPNNPCQRVKPPKAEYKEGRFLQDTEVIDLFKHLDKEPLQYKAMITALIYTGMRRGELLGLKWSDIDFKNKTIEIKRTILYLPSKGIFEDTTKTDTSKRVIKVADVVLNLLQEHKKQQNINKLKCGDLWKDNNFIFTAWDGSPFLPDTLTSWFSKFIKKNNLPGVTIHSLRHTNATLLIANGVNVTTVSKRLGHATTATTTKIYAHALKTADEIASDTLQNILKAQ